MPRRIHVALIDSGVDPQRLPERHRARACQRGDIVLKDGAVSQPMGLTDDELGHGTANATLLLDASPFIDVTSFRIFDKDHRASFDLVLAALQSALRRGVDVICCPLGTPDPVFMTRAAPLVRNCEVAGVTVVAPASFHGLPSYPGSCEGAVGVLADSAMSAEVRPRATGALFTASPLPPADFPHAPPGASFAAARVAGEVARRMAESSC